MRRSRPHFPRLAIFALLVSLLPSLALEGHGPSQHPTLPGFDDGTVFLSDHPEADRTLHIENVAAIGVSHCEGCLLPKKESSDFADQPTAGPLVGRGARLSSSSDPGAARWPHSPQAPRAPPVL